MGWFSIIWLPIPIQFDFRSKYATIERIHRIAKRIYNDIEDRYCTAILLDVSQAFNKIWRQRLLYKVKNSFPIDLYAIIRFYLLHRTFRVKYGEIIQLKEINSGVPQDSVLRPVLCYILLIFRSLWASQHQAMRTTQLYLSLIII